MKLLLLIVPFFLIFGCGSSGLLEDDNQNFDSAESIETLDNLGITTEFGKVIEGKYISFTDSFYRFLIEVPKDDVDLFEAEQSITLNDFDYDNIAFDEFESVDNSKIFDYQESESKPFNVDSFRYTKTVFRGETSDSFYYIFTISNQ